MHLCCCKWHYFVFLWLSYTPYMLHIIFVHSSVGGYLGCFHVSTTVNSAAMNIGVHIFLNYSFVWIYANEWNCWIIWQLKSFLEGQPVKYNIWTFPKWNSGTVAVLFSPNTSCSNSFYLEEVNPEKQAVFSPGQPVKKSLLLHRLKLHCRFMAIISTCCNGRF